MKKFLYVLFLFITELCFAQVTDNFSDGDFTNSPAWSGDAAKFVVNTGFQLQLNSTGTDSSYLSVPNTVSLNNCEWNFWIRLNLPPSSSNNARVYLVSDQQNLKSPLNGYYLQFGEALTNDQVELFRQSGNTLISVCRGTTLIATNFAIRVKVTRDALATWRLYIDPAGGNAFQLEATGTDSVFNATSYFGMVCKYTSSNATKFYFDDFYVGPMILDTIPPMLTGASVLSSTQLDVHFNEQIDSSTAQNVNNYSVNNSIGIPANAQRDLSDLTLVHLTFATSFQSSLLYTLTANNISDLSGNTLTSNSTMDFVIAEAAQPNDIVINEILYDPLTGGEDFVELYNRSPKVINLAALNIASGDYDTQILDDINAITTENVFLFPGEYAVLTESPEAVMSQYYSASPGAFVQVASMPAYNIDNDIVALVDASQTVIDRLLYSDTWQFPLLNDTKGVSLERINPGKLSQDNTNWHSAAESAGFATPGYRNSQYSETSGDGSEIAVVPEIFSPDNDGYNDVATINYHFDAAGYTANVIIFDSRGRQVRKLTANELLGTSGSFVWDGVNDKREKASIGIYIVFVEVYKLDGLVKSFKKTCVLASRL